MTFTVVGSPSAMRIALLRVALGKNSDATTSPASGKKRSLVTKHPCARAHVRARDQRVAMWLQRCLCAFNAAIR